MTSRAPLHIAVIGAHPAGIHAAEMAICNGMRHVHVDIIDSRPFIPGLVRPQRGFDLTTQPLDEDYVTSHLRFIGNITVGQDIPQSLLSHYYDAVISTVSSVDGVRPEDFHPDRTPATTAGDLVAHLREAEIATTTWQGWYRLDDSVRRGSHGWEKAIAAAHGIPVVP